jgi:hypothetical protein
MARTIEELLDVFLDFAITHSDFPPLSLRDTPREAQEIIAVTNLTPTHNINQLKTFFNLDDTSDVAIICPDYYTILRSFTSSPLLLDAEENSTFIAFLQTVDTQTEDEKKNLIDNYVIAPLFQKKHIDASQVYIAIPSFGTTSTIYTKFIDAGD